MKKWGWILKNKQTEDKYCISTEDAFGGSKSHDTWLESGQSTKYKEAGEKWKFLILKYWKAMSNFSKTIVLDLLDKTISNNNNNYRKSLLCTI